MFCDDHQNNIDEAMEMYQQMHKWDDAIDVADAKVRMCLDDLVSLTCRLSPLGEVVAAL